MSQPEILRERSGPLINFQFSLANTVSSFNNEIYVDIDPEKDFKNTIIKDDRKVDVGFWKNSEKDMWKWNTSWFTQCHPSPSTSV